MIERKSITFCDRTSGTLHELSTIVNVLVQDATRGIGEPYLRLSIAFLLQILSNTSQGTTSAGSTNETVNITLGLFPNFRPSRNIMRIRIGGIVKLVCPYGVLKLLGVLLCLVIIVERILVGDRGDRMHFSTEHSEKVNLLLALSTMALARKTVAT
jgi:hypothetical protein